MSSAIKMSHILMEANEALVETLVKALREVGHAPTVSTLPRFLGRPDSPGDPTIDEWLSSFDLYVRQCGVAEGDRAVLLVDYLGGCAKEEALCYPDEIRRDFGVLVSRLRRVFGPWETVTSLYADFYSRMQSVGETLAEFSRVLIRLHQRIEGAAPTIAERQALAVLADGALKHQFVVGVRDECVRYELRRLVLRLADKPFIIVREEALCLLCEEEASVVAMRPVEKAAPCLSGPVGGSMSCVLGLDAVVSCDGGVTAGDVGRCVSVGDERRDMELSGVDTVVSGIISGCGLCDLDRVSGGGDTNVSRVDTVVSGDSVSRVVVHVAVMSLAGDGDTVVSGVDEPVCSDSLVMTADEFDVCACDSDSSVMTADELDMCACDSLVSGGAGDSSSVEVVDDVVACGGDTVLPDAFRVGDWLSVVGLGVAQPGWVDGLVCADDSLRPEPPPVYAMCLCRSL